MSTGTWLLVATLLAIVALIVLIARYRLNPFVTLIAVSLALGLAVGMPAGKVVAAYEEGVGKALGHIALVVALGTMLGKLMAESGGAERIARTLVARFGERRVPWAMVCIAFVVGLPVFFEVGFVLLVPVAFNVARRTGTPLLLVGLPMVAGLSVVHGLVPPHPAAMLAVQSYHADTGRTLLYALLVGVPTAILAGPVFARFAAARVQAPKENPIAEALLAKGEADRPDDALPGFGITLLTILMPVLLMLLGGCADLLSPTGSLPNQLLHLLGNAVVALLLAAVLSFYTLGFARGFDREQILRFTQECLAPTAAIILLIGAGGGLSGILLKSGVADQVVVLARALNLSPLLMGWTLAALMRLATGSATVALTTATGIVAPVALAQHYPHPELLVLATGAGSLIFSHVNDGGFWMVKQYFNLSVAQTLKTWSVLETIISVAALALTAALAAVL